MSGLNSQEARMGRLDERVAIVTGSGQGIGRAVARVLAHEGAAVLLASRTAHRVEQVAQEIVASGGRARAVGCDVLDPEQIDAAVAACIDAFGPPDILVNNAQGGHMGGGVPLEQTEVDVLDQTLHGGLYATFHAMRACFPHMRERGGTIVNFGSSTGVGGDPGFAAYGLNKEAIHGLTKHAAREWGRHGITVNTICPAALTENLQAKFDEHPKWRDAIVKAVPLGRLGDPETDIAPAVLALATDLRFLTGATLMLDGGRVLLR
jgi:NAD(P)-dependent dehydrogenase (short-subunit alcohol dehydrogenase family)